MSSVLFVMRDDGDMTEPMNIMLLSALAKNRDRAWQTYLAVLERDDIADVVRKMKPDVVAFSAITGSHQALLDANRRVKAVSDTIRTVIGGPYASFRPNVILDEPFDALGVGECDDAWPELLDVWETGGSPDDISNIVTQGNARRVLKRTILGEKNWSLQPEHLRPRKTNMDDLPFMDRALIYTNTAFRNRYKRTMMAGRGCPFRCTYCFEHQWNAMYQGKGKVLQRHSVERLCAELRKLKTDWDTRFIKFYDDVFPVFDAVDGEWLEEFARVYPREVGLPFHCLVRAEQVNQESAHKLRLLKMAGIASITMSIEGGNAFARDYVLIRDMTEDDLRCSFELCRDLQIPTFANTILAVPVPTRPEMDAPDFDDRVDHIVSVAKDINPGRKSAQRKLGEDIEAIRVSDADEMSKRFKIRSALGEAGVRDRMLDYDIESIWFNVQLGVSFGEFPVFFPYQGTQLGEYAVKHGYFDGNYDKLHASYQTVSPLDCYTDEERMVQQNLALLGTFVLWFAGSYNPVVRAFARPITTFSVWASKFPFRSVYLRLYTLSKNDMHARRVYPMHYSWKERVRYLLDNWMLDRFKQVKKPRHRGERPGQTLGGPPSV